MLLFLVSVLTTAGSDQAGEGSLAQEILKADLRMTQMFKLDLNSRFCP